MTKRIKVLYTIPNFETAGSGIVLYKLLSKLNLDLFEPEIACFHDRGYLFQKVKLLGFPVHIFNFCHPMRPILFGLIHCWRVSRFFKKNKYNIIYSFHYHADYSEAIAARIAGIKWVFVKKNMGWFGPNLRAWKLRSFLAHRIIVQNTDMMNLFYSGSSKVELISIGVDTNEFYPRDKDEDFKSSLGFNKSDYLIISVSSLLPLKGVDLIIDAFISLVPYYPNIRLLVLGNDKSDYAEGLRAKLDKLQYLDKFVFFKGFQNDISKWLNISDLSIQSTRNISKGEGAPIVMQESMATGCLVLGSNVAGLKDQLQKFPELLFNSSDVNDLIIKIRFVLDLSQEDKHNYRKNLVDEINLRYSLNSEVNLHQKMLLNLLNEKDCN